VPPCLSRLWRALRDPRTGAAAARARNELPQVRTALLRAIEDCDGQNAERLQHQIRHARNHRDLWMLRSDAYRLIALQHCQSIAEQRIRQLLHLFEGRVAPHELSL
jgi:hypothetical protein